MLADLSAFTTQSGSLRPPPHYKQETVQLIKLCLATHFDLSVALRLYIFVGVLCHLPSKILQILNSLQVQSVLLEDFFKSSLLPGSKQENKVFWQIQSMENLLQTQRIWSESQSAYKLSVHGELSSS